MALAAAVQGGKSPSQIITWETESDLDLTGATITAKIRRQNQSLSEVISGTFTVTDGPNRKFRWDYADEDVLTAGTHKIQFTASLGGDPTPAKTFIVEWVVKESL